MIKQLFFVISACGIILRVTSHPLFDESLNKEWNGVEKQPQHDLSEDWVPNYKEFARSFTNAHSGGPEWEEHKFQTPDRPDNLRHLYEDVDGNEQYSEYHEINEVPYENLFM